MRSPVMLWAAEFRKGSPSGMESLTCWSCGWSLQKYTLEYKKDAFFDKFPIVFLLVLTLEHAVRGSKLQESKEMVDRGIHREDT